MHTCTTVPQRELLATAQINIKGLVLRSCLRSVLLVSPPPDNLSATQQSGGADVWMRGAPHWARNLAARTCMQARLAEPSLFVVDASGVVIGTPLPHRVDLHY